MFKIYIYIYIYIYIETKLPLERHGSPLMRSPKCQLQPTDCSRKQEAPATPPQHMSQNSTHDN